ncbi:MAG TPA: hypothetical protein VE591_02980 [Candidatus Acidoferrum sp.]|jgi:hypothetical protein|nr:hypothetical protein [Candidatus Acidoferrum sp.]
MTLSTRRDSDLILVTDPTARSLRGVLQADPVSALVAERQREIARLVRSERLIAVALEAEPARGASGVRHAIAAALIAIARKLEAESLESAMRTRSPQLDAEG